MLFELNLLEQSLETAFTNQNRTKPLLRWLLISFVIIFIIPKSDTDDFFLLRIIFVFALIAYHLYSFSGESDEIKIQNYYIGKLKIYADYLLFEVDGRQTIIDANFKGELIFKYEGYHEEVIGYSRNPNIYYGTDNTVTIIDNKEEQIFYLFLGNKHNRKRFYQLIEWADDKKLNYKEYTRNERTYLGEKLKFKEIQDFKSKK
ncbi:MAG: hypothetical protein AAFP82_00315 [Bacteroidota bacterium]